MITFRALLRFLDQLFPTKKYIFLLLLQLQIDSKLAILLVCMAISMYVWQLGSVILYFNVLRIHLHIQGL